MFTGIIPFKTNSLCLHILNWVTFFWGYKRDSITSIINAWPQMESDTRLPCVHKMCRAYLHMQNKIGQWLAEWVSYLEGYGGKRTQSIDLPIQTVVSSIPAGCLYVWQCISKLVQKHVNGVFWYPYACGMSECKWVQCSLGHLSACYCIY